MNLHFATFISLLLSYPILGLFEILFLGFIEGLNLSLFLVGFLLHIVFPVLAPLVYGFYHGGDYFISERNVRPPLFIPGVFSYALSSFIFNFYGFRLLYLLEVCCFVSSLILMFASIYFKVSVHVASITIPVFFFYLTGFSLAMLFSPMIILVCWARWKLKAHSLLQILAGFITGLFSTILAVFMF